MDNEKKLINVKFSYLKESKDGKYVDAGKLNVMIDQKGRERVAVNIGKNTYWGFLTTVKKQEEKTPQDLEHNIFK